MADKRFFDYKGPFRLKELAEISGAELHPSADGERQVKDLSPLDRAGADEIGFLDNPKYIASFERSRAGACVIRERHAAKAPLGMNLLITENPYLAFAKITDHFYPADYSSSRSEVAQTAAINSTAKIGKNVWIEPFVTIGAGVEIGDDCHIGSGTVIGRGVKIGNGCFIGNNSSLSCCLVGNGAIIHNGVRIGQDGFGFAQEKGRHVKVPQVGRVIIGDNVEIGANSCIDRGSGPDTIIGDGTKIDNLVQIGHNVHIGKHCIIVAQVGISGSTQLGDYVMIGGQAGLTGHLKIGAQARIAAGSGVGFDISPGESYGGYPAIPIKEWHRLSFSLKKIAEEMGAKLKKEKND